MCVTHEERLSEITPEMMEAGETVILEAIGGSDVGGMFSAADLAREVFEAMVTARCQGVVLLKGP